MGLSVKAKEVIAELDQENIKRSDIKKMGKTIKKDHELAMELWSTADQPPRLLSVLIMDKKLLTQELIDQLASDMQEHEPSQRNQLSDWFLANQLMKSKKTIALIESWEQSSFAVLRRLFWYHQARLRWTGQTPPENSAYLLDVLEKNMAGEEPEVQWTMNFCAGWIGIYQPEFRERCVKLGEALGLYKGDPVARNCTPSYLPEFIRIEVGKREK